MMKNSPRRPSHAHEDNLAVLFEAFGRPVLVDPGRWIYDRSPDRMWVIAAVAHNTPWISDRPPSDDDFDDAACQGRYHERWFHLVDRTGGAMADVTTTGVEGALRWARTAFRGFVTDRAAEVARHVWMSGDAERPWLLVADHFKCPNDHHWTNSFLLPTDAELTGEHGLWQVPLDGDLHLTLAAASSSEMALEQETRFWCRNYAQKEPALWLRFGGRMTSGLRAFAFVPSAGEPREVALEAAGREIALRVDDMEYTLSVADQSPSL